MAQYDISSKVLFADYERDFIALTLGTQDFEILGPIPTEFPSVQMRMTDAPMVEHAASLFGAVLERASSTFYWDDPLSWVSRITFHVSRFTPHTGLDSPDSRTFR